MTLVNNFNIIILLQYNINMTTTMLGSYDDESGIGIATPCLKFNMHWEGYPLKSRFNAKLVQYPDELMPRFYIKKEIFEK